MSTQITCRPSIAIEMMKNDKSKYLSTRMVIKNRSCCETVLGRICNTCRREGENDYTLSSCFLMCVFCMFSTWRADYVRRGSFRFYPGSRGEWAEEGKGCRVQSAPARYRSKPRSETWRHRDWRQQKTVRGSVGALKRCPDHSCL